MPHKHEPHTHEQHKAKHKKAAEIFNRALNECVRSEICLDVILREMTDILVQAAITHDCPLSELTANLIDVYEDVRDYVASAKTEKVLKPVGGPQ